MQVTNQNREYSPSLVTDRFVQRDITSNGYVITEVSAAGWTLREGRVEAGELPDEVRAKADAERYSMDARVPWPLDDNAGRTVKRDLLAGIGEGSSPLEHAAKQVLREALDRVEVHPCDRGDDAVAAKELSPELQALLQALTGHNAS
ncbi:hypothetical protein ACVXHM_16735 [Pseudomonas aeruginosa]|jgi:hypothetical protein|nr:MULTISPECIES: hypothetical protein [Pseudomonas]MCR7873197.1 hypothetical protein [Pseudomonas aeruginosa]UTN36229.1 hypothetical protein MMZ75_32985 [Pseudomonas aeruginosa]